MKPPPLRERAPQVSEDLASLVHDMLAKDYAVRPSMDQVLARLDGDGERSKRLQRRVGILGLTLLVVLLVLGGWGLKRRQTTAPTPVPTAHVAAPAVVVQPPEVTAPPPKMPTQAPAEAVSAPTSASPLPLASPPPLARPEAAPAAATSVQPPAKKRSRRIPKREEIVPPDSSSEPQKGILKTVNFGKD